MTFDEQKVLKSLPKELSGDQYIMEEIYNYWTCSNEELVTESITLVLNYIFEEGKRIGMEKARNN